MLVGGALLLFVAVLMLAMIRARPAWYAPAGAFPEQAALAEAFERRALSVLSDAHPFGVDWTFTLTADEARAWISHRLPEWLANQNAAHHPHPEGIRAGVSFTPDDASIGVLVRTWIGDTVAWARVGLPCEAREAAASPRTVFGLGRVRMPAWMLGVWAPELPRLLERTREPARGARAGGPREATITLDDGRRVFLRRVEGGTGTVTLTCRTERRSK